MATPQTSSDHPILEHISAVAPDAITLAQTIWDAAELGYQETRSTEVLQAFLADHGFAIETGVAAIPTAFLASYSHHGKPLPGKGKQDAKAGPVIGILAEFDALPGLSQAAVPVRQPIQGGIAGHACGHHLFGAASVTAAIAVKQWLEQSNTSGTVRVYGTPAEEGGSGKVYMARSGLFDDNDIVLHWHPGDRNNASPSSTTANKSGRFTFSGRAAHAASAPHRGRSALDGVEAMNYMVNLMREHIPSDSRIHYVITDGGDAPNIVPETAQVYYYVRHPKAATAKKLFERVVAAARGAAQGTGTSMDVEVMHGNYPVLPNNALSQLVHEKMTSIGGIYFTEEENNFARSIRRSLLGSGASLGSENQVAPLQFHQGMGSTDVGDVSWNVPTAGFSTVTWVPGTPAHSWQAVAAGGMSIGHKGMLHAAKVLALTAADLFTDPSQIEPIQAEFEQRRGADFRYEPLLGNRAPPLDYRRTKQDTKKAIRQ